jgi:hypothetical protein
MPVSGSHEFEYTVGVGQIWAGKPWMDIGQIHDASSDAMAIKMKPDTQHHFRQPLQPDDHCGLLRHDHPTPLYTGYNATQGESCAFHTIKVNVSGGGTCKIYVDGVLKITSSAMVGKGTGHYWKFGAYGQSGWPPVSRPPPPPTPSTRATRPPHSPTI